MNQPTITAEEAQRMLDDGRWAYHPDAEECARTVIALHKQLDAIRHAAARRDSLDLDAIEARADEQPRMLVVTVNRESTGSLDAQSWIVDERGNPLTAPIAPSLARFIAAARSDVPAPVAAVRALAALV